MKRTIQISIEVQDPTHPPSSLLPLLDAVSDYVAREWDANVSAKIVYDSDGDPNYQKVHNED